MKNESSKVRFMKKSFHDMLSIKAKEEGYKISKEESDELFSKTFGSEPREQFLNLAQDLDEKEFEALKIVQEIIIKNDLPALKNSAEALALPLFIEREIEGFTLFELACKYGNYDAANYLIIYKPKFREDKDGASIALNLAVKAKNTKLVKLILESFKEQINRNNLGRALAATMPDTIPNTSEISLILMKLLKDISDRDINICVSNLLNNSLIYLKDKEHQKQVWFNPQKEASQPNPLVYIVNDFFKNVHAITDITGAKPLIGEKNWHGIGDLYILTQNYIEYLAETMKDTKGSADLKESQLLDDRKWCEIIELSAKLYDQLSLFIKDPSSKYR